MRRAAGVFLVLAGCSSDADVVSSSGSGGLSAGATSVSTVTVGSDATSTGEASGSAQGGERTSGDIPADDASGSTQGDSAECGDGVVGGDEDCDAPGDDTCTPSCTFPGTKLWENLLWPACDTERDIGVGLSAAEVISVTAFREDDCFDSSTNNGVHRGTLDAAGAILAENSVMDWAPGGSGSPLVHRSGATDHFTATTFQVSNGPLVVTAWDDAAGEIWSIVDEGEPRFDPRFMTVTDGIGYLSGLQTDLGVGLHPTIIAVANTGRMWTRTFETVADNLPSGVFSTSGRVFALFGSMDSSLCSVDLDGLDPQCQSLGSPRVARAVAAGDDFFVGLRAADDVSISRRDLGGVRDAWSTVLPRPGTQQHLGLARLLVDDERVYAVGTRFDDGRVYAYIVVLRRSDGEVVVDVAEPERDLTDAVLMPDGSVVTVGNLITDSGSATHTYVARWAL